MRTFKFEKKQGRVANRRYTELLPRLVRVAAHGMFADLQIASDFLRTPVVSKPLQNFFFPWRQCPASFQGSFSMFVSMQCKARY